MSRKRSDPRDEASKMASLAIVWSVLAGVAYLGLIAVVVDQLKAALHTSDPTIETHGLMALKFDSTGLISPSVFSIALTAIPFAIGAALLLAIVGRIRPGLVPVPAVLVAAALVGLLASAALFLDQVSKPENRLGFLIAVSTIVGVWLLVRLAGYVRQLHRRNPAVSTLLLAVLVIAYLVASNAGNISSLVLRQIDVWLAVIAFIITLYAAIRFLQESIRMRG